MSTRTRDLPRSNLADVDWLARHLGDPSIAAVDCRFELANPDGGRRAYAEAHIPGAVYLNAEQDLSGPQGPHGGRHPLPAVEQLSRTFGALGIDDTITVVAYDVPQHGFAPRLWWLLRYLGHDAVLVLNGGWPAWRAAGLPVSREPGPPRARRQFTPRPRPELACDLDHVRRIAVEGGAVLVDSRAPERYRGEIEPLDPVAGHIPGAINVPWTATLDAQGRMKAPAELVERFNAVRGRADAPIVYCGSGLTACANLLAMEEAGIRGARLYPGSWSDWCSYPENPVARGDAPAGGGTGAGGGPSFSRARGDPRRGAGSPAQTGQGDPRRRAGSPAQTGQGGAEAMTVREHGAAAPIFDGHNDTVLSMVKTGRSFFERSEAGHIDLPRAREGGLGGGFFAVYIADPAPAATAPSAGGARGEAQALESAMRRYEDERTWPEPMPLDYAEARAVELLGRLLQIVDTSDGQVAAVHTAADLQACLDRGTFAMLLHLEGAEPLDPDGRALETFYAAGVRSVGLTHSRRNRFATGVPFKFPSSPDTGPGLTDLGRALVRQLNARRVMIDLSHINEQGFWDVAKLSRAPLVCTHSNAHALSASARNLTDRQMDAIKDSGGIAGLNFHVGFLRQDGGRDPHTTPIARMVDHIEYMTERMGIDHVALGSDFDGATMPAELKDAAGLPRLMDGLRARGHTEVDLAKVAHGNWVRVLRETWGA
jgi:membrane dipeptidase